MGSPESGRGIWIGLNGLLSRLLGMLVGAAITLGIPAGFWGLVTATSLADDYKEHKETEQVDRDKIRAKQEILWEHDVQRGVKDAVVDKTIAEAREERKELNKKLDALLIKQGINPAEVVK